MHSGLLANVVTVGRKNKCILSRIANMPHYPQETLAAYVLASTSPSETLSLQLPLPVS